MHLLALQSIVVCWKSVKR